MSVLEVIALLSFGLACFKAGYLVGKMQKNNRPRPHVAVIFYLTKTN